jgi:hypothetical protein
VPGAVCYQTPRQLGWRHRLAAWLHPSDHGA